MAVTKEDISMTGFAIVAYAGDAKTALLKALDNAREGKIEEAKKANESIQSFRACFKYGNPNTIVKTATRLLGHNVGACRAPFNQVPQAGIDALKKVLEENKAKGMC